MLESGCGPGLAGGLGLDGWLGEAGVDAGEAVGGGLLLLGSAEAVGGEPSMLSEDVVGTTAAPSSSSISCASTS